MARIRSVHPGLASDESFMSMSALAKAGWILLWTECDDNGVFEWKPTVLKARIFPGDNVNFEELLAEWESLNCVKKIEVEAKYYGLVRNFRKYQRPQKPNYRYPLPEEHVTFVGFPYVPSATGIVSVAVKTNPSHQNHPPRKEEGGKRFDEGDSMDVGDEEILAAGCGVVESQHWLVIEVADRVSATIGIAKTRALVAKVESWISEGYDNPALIEAAVSSVLQRRRERGETKPPRSLNYYDDEVKSQHRHYEALIHRVEQLP